MSLLLFVSDFVTTSVAPPHTHPPPTTTTSSFAENGNGLALSPLPRQPSESPISRWRNEFWAGSREAGIKHDPADGLSIKATALQPPSAPKKPNKGPKTKKVSFVWSQPLEQYNDMNKTPDNESGPAVNAGNKSVLLQRV